MDYLDVIYDPHKKPFTAYPNQLTKHIVETMRIRKNTTLLDVGCGRGEFSNGFVKQGIDVYSVDKQTSSTQALNGREIFSVDLENEKLPFPDNFFDFIFSKSVIEHFHRPEELFTELHRVLKPGGTIITMCPAWEYNYKIYYEDFTHRTPFMKVSLEDFLHINNFEQVKVEYFIQLPSVWHGWKRPFACSLVFLTRHLVPSFLKKHSKWVRFSKEVMLFSVAKKPNAS